MIPTKASDADGARARPDRHVVFRLAVQATGVQATNGTSGPGSLPFRPRFEWIERRATTADELVSTEVHDLDVYRLPRPTSVTSAARQGERSEGA